MVRRLNQPITASDWPGLRVWLIGASSGIGAALARALAAQGAQLTLSARNAEALSLVAEQCRTLKTSPDIHLLPVDVCNRSDMKAAIEQIRERWHGIDLILFNSGSYDPVRIDTLSADLANRSLTVNLLAPIDATAELLPLLLSMPEDGRPRGFAYVASVAGYRGLPRALTYGPGKAGLINFAESLWVDLHPMGLNSWVINPGFVRTRLTDQNDFQMPALIEPDEAAQSILDGFARGLFEIHFPKRFTRFMKLMRILPISWYLRLVQRLVPVLPRSNTLTPGNPAKESK